MASSGWWVILPWRLAGTVHFSDTQAARRNSSPECVRHRSRLQAWSRALGVGQLLVTRAPVREAAKTLT